MNPFANRLLASRSLEQRLKFDYHFTLNKLYRVDIVAPNGQRRATVVMVPSRGQPRVLVWDRAGKTWQYRIAGDHMVLEGKGNLKGADEKLQQALTQEIVDVSLKE